MIASLLLTAVLGGAPPAVPDQTLIFYNARLAGREKHPAEVLKLWLLHNAVASQKGQPGTFDHDFLTSVWVALGELGYCPDGLPDDARGAGLWPIALQNWLVHNLSRGPPTSPATPFNAFDVGKQQRHVSLHDVLTYPEFRSVSFFRTECTLPWTTMWELEGTGWPNLKDRIVVARLLRKLLRQARTTIVPGKVEQTAAIEARIFDIDLLLGELQARAARRKARATRLQSRGLGVAEGSDEPLLPAFKPDSEEGRILRNSLQWTPAAWLSLSRERRLFLFSRAKPVSSDPPALQRLELSLLDAIIDKREGAEAEQWIGMLGGKETPSERRAVFAGERGRRLLELDRPTRFRERAVIALHRGVAFLEEGNLDESLRSFAYALSYAAGSREERAVLALARRWLSYVLSRHETTDAVVATLKALAPRTDYNAILEDLVWRAALTADAKSFELCARSTSGNSAFDARIKRLRPLAHGNPAEFGTQLRKGLTDETFVSLRFLKQLVEKVEGEGGDVRRAQAPTLAMLLKLVAPLTQGEGVGSQKRASAELMERIQAVLEGLPGVEATPAGTNPERGLSPRTETFAGSIRLAPSDPLPWPFAVADAPPPAAIAQLGLEPVEWRGPEGELVMGWRLVE
ncbi:MAG: hypothetical protein ACYC8T_11470 [Myxococcaceae bacterium]